MRSKTRIGWLVVAVAALSTSVAPTARALHVPDEVPSEYRSPAVCGAEDTPETGIQGDIPRSDQDSGRAAQGYNCGLAAVGHLAGGSGALAVMDHCAYMASGAGIRVIDVSDPEHPEEVGLLPTRVSTENITARRYRNRAILVAGTTPPGGVDVPLTGSWLAVYDVRECAAPVLKGHVKYAGSQGGASRTGLHNAHLSPDTTHVIGSMPLTIADITNLDDESSWRVSEFQCEVQKQTHLVHKTTGACDVVSPEDTQVLNAPHQVAHIGEYRPDAERLYVGAQAIFAPDEEYMRILDTTVWPARVVSEWPGSGHTISWFTRGNGAYLLHGGELGAPGLACIPHRPLDAPPSANVNEGPDGHDYREVDPRPYISDITDETAPQTISKLELAITRPDPDMCAASVESGQTAAPHWHNIERARDPRFSLMSQTSAGLRVWDIRNPDNPVEIAYFNPGNSSTTPYFNKSTGHIWLSAGGEFWVLEFERDVRDALGLGDPPLGYFHPDGLPTKGDATPPATAATAAAWKSDAHRQHLFCQIEVP